MRYDPYDPREHKMLRVERLQCEEATLERQKTWWGLSAIGVCVGLMGFIGYALWTFTPSMVSPSVVVGGLAAIAICSWLGGQKKKALELLRYSLHDAEDAL